MNRKLLVILALIAIVGIVAYRAWGLKFDWGLFFASFRDVRPGWLAASVVATFATFVLRSFRWQVLLDPIKRVHLHVLMTATLIGFSAIYILGRAGELVRPVWLTRKEQIVLSSSVAAILVERFLDSVMLVIMFAWTLLVVELPAAAHAAEPMARMKNVAWVLVIGAIGAALVMFLFRSNIDRIVDLIPFKNVGRHLHNFSQGLSFLQNGRSFGLAMGYSLVLWIVIALQFWFMMLGMKFELGFSASTLVMVGAAIGSIAQIPGIGGGFQAGFVFCLGTFFAIPAERALAASLVAWVFSYVPTLGCAAVYMMATGITWKDIRGLETT